MKLYDVYPLYDVEIVRGRGCHVYDAAGTEYLDLYGGHAVISVGHCHPRYVEAVSSQLHRLGFYSNSVINPLQAALARRVGEMTGLDDWQLFLVNSGAEANENALKLASFATGRDKIVAFNKAFHGRTSAAVEATDNPAINAPINRAGHVTFLPLNDIAAVKERLAARDVAAVIIEGIQGVGGIRVPSADFLQQLRRECDATGTVLIIDEVQSGWGRTGRFFAFEHAGVMPDLITCAKGMGNGFPVGAVLIAPQFTPVYGQLGTTFGGNHLACAAAIAVLDIMDSESLVDNAARVGNHLMSRLKEVDGVAEVRGRGLMIGVEMAFEAKELRRHLIMKEHVFTGASGSHTIRLLPPLTLTMEEADSFVSRFKKAIEECRSTK